MNVLSALIKCTSIAFLVGFFSKTGADLGNDILPLAGLIVLIITIVVLFELTNLAPATGKGGLNGVRAMGREGRVQVGTDAEPVPRKGIETSMIGDGKRRQAISLNTASRVREQRR